MLQKPKPVMPTDAGMGAGMGLGMGMDMFGPLGQMGDPITRGPGKSIARQHMGSIIGKRGAGTGQLGGGDLTAHSVGHYGKGGLPGMTGGKL